jgi:outer membrane protein assembly factor BamB
LIVVNFFNNFIFFKSYFLKKTPPKYCKRAKIINSQENHYHHQSLERALKIMFLMKLAIEGIKMKSKMTSMVLSIVIVASLSIPIPQNVGPSNSSLSETVSLALSNISAPIPQILEKTGLSPIGTGGLANSPWPMFRQNLNHTGVSPYDTSTNNGQLKWSFKTGDWVESSPVIGSNGTIYVGSHDHKLYAINIDGTKKWSFTTDAPIDSLPAIGSDGTIYIGSSDGRLYSIDPDGTEKWRFTTDGMIQWSSPAIDSDSTIYIGSTDYKLYAINSDGSEKWNFTAGNGVHSSPAIGFDGTIYVGSHDNKLYAINIDGTKKWSFTTGDTINSSPAIGSDGTIYVGSHDNILYAINPDGTKKWSFKTGGRVFSSPAIGSDSTIYVGSRSVDNKLYAINPDGTKKWSFTTNGCVVSSPAIGSDGTIYVGSHDNKLYAVNSDGTEKWSFVTGHFVRSSPAIGSDGTIYVGSYDTKLYAIGKTDIPPIADAGLDQTVNEGDVVQFNVSASYDPDGTIESYEWDFGGNGIYDYIETTNSSPDGAFDGKTTHTYGDNGMYKVTLRVTDDTGLNDTDTCNVTVNNVAPNVNTFPTVTINEFESVTLTGHATDPGSDDLTFTWNWGYAPWGDKTTIYSNDGTGPDPYPSPTLNPRNITEDATCQFGDDGVFTVNLTVTDDDGGSTTVMTNVTVNNVAPIVTIESAVIGVEIGLRVAGRKYNDVRMTLYEEGNPIGNVSIERMPGSPNDQMAWIPVTLDMTKIYNVTVTYTPEDPPKKGSNPVWIYIKFENGKEERIHHTFNVQQSKKRDSDHWNHVEPWEVDLNLYLIGHEFEVISHITDPGSDDDILIYTYGSQIVNVTYLNNPPNLDLYPSPEVNSRDIMDTRTLIYEGPGTVTLVVIDDDNIRLGVGQGSDSIDVI